MKFIICDESCTNCRFFVLGALVLPVHNHSILTEELSAWKTAHRLNAASEFKWTKVSRGYLPLYAEMMRWLFSHLRAGHLQVRVLVMDTRDSHYKTFCERQTSKGFYKAYYHLLLQSTKQVLYDDPNDRVLVLLDEKRERYPFHKEVLKKALNSALRRDRGASGRVSNVEDRQSSGPHGEVLIQPVDVLIGAVGFARNGFAARPGASPAKQELVRLIEQEAGSTLAYDTSPRSSFNVWTFDLGIAMARKATWKDREQRAKRKRPQA
jgi:hypothetical protein